MATTTQQKNAEALAKAQKAAKDRYKAQVAPTRTVSTPTSSSKFKEVQLPTGEVLTGAAARNYGKPDTTPQIAPFTTEEMGRAVIDTEIAKQQATERSLFGETYTGSNLEKSIKEQARLKEMETAQAQREVDFQMQQRATSLSDLENQAGSAKATYQAKFSPGREGVVSTQAPNVARKYGVIIDQKVDQAKEAYRLASDNAGLIKERLQKALEQDKKQLATQLRGQLAQAELQAAQIETDLLNAQQRMSAETRANIQSFQDIVQSGVTLNPQALQQFASTMGIPEELTYNYYLGAQAIRDDKTLSLEQKQVALAEASRQYQDNISGFEFEEARKIRDYERLVRDGYDPAELAVAMDIPNARNPLYQAELRLNQANATKAYKNANGIPITQEDFLNEANALAELNRLQGNGAALVTPNSLEGISMSWDGGRLEFDLPVDANGQLKPFQCGEFVNRSWGIAKGGSGGFGNSKESKFQRVVNNGIQIGSINAGNYNTMIKPGMAFVTDDGPYGHVGIVTQVLPNGQFLTMEANFVGNESRGSAPTQRTRSINDANLKGFVYPPNAQAKTATGKQDIDQIANILETKAPNQAMQKQVKDKVSSYVNAGNTQGLQDYTMNLVWSDLGEEAKKSYRMGANIKETGAELKQLMQEYTDAGGKLGWFNGNWTQLVNKIGKSRNPELQNMTQRMRFLLEKFARAQTGAAIQDFEKKNFRELLPTMTDSQGLAVAKIDAVSDAIEAEYRGLLKSELGETTYNTIFGQQQSVGQAEDVWSKYAGGNDFTTNLYQDYGISN